MNRTIVICGNGASAAILLGALARKGADSSVSIIVIGARGHIGEGVAYATANHNHLLNAPASRMSADPLQPDHFIRWVKGRGVPTDGWSGQFLPRSLYADYLNALVRDVMSANPDMRVRILSGEVQSLIRNRTGWMVSYSNGAPILADIVVLATGNDMPTAIADRYRPEIARRVIDNPWADSPIHTEENVLVLGSGLTAIDAVICLLDRGHSGAIHLLSRRGLLPAGHVEPAMVQPLEPPWPATILGLTRALRGAAGRSPPPAQWQGLMEAMRPHWAQIWQQLDDPEKRRFLRHAATLWSTHRHRAAPQIASRIEAALSRNVNLLKGRLLSLTNEGPNTVAAAIAYGGSIRSLLVNRIINCTGPNTDPAKTHDPLIENIIASRQARSTSVDVGLDVDKKNRVRNTEGMVQPSLFAMGALTRGCRWEITAIPEIGVQAANMAGHIMEQLGLPDAATRVSQPRDRDVETLPHA